MSLLESLHFHDPSPANYTDANSPQLIPLGCDLGILRASLGFSSDRILSHLNLIEKEIVDTIAHMRALRMIHNKICHGEISSRQYLYHLVNKIRRGASRMGSREADWNSVDESGKETIAELISYGLSKSCFGQVVTSRRHLTPPLGGWYWLQENLTLVQTTFPEGRAETSHPSVRAFRNDDGTITSREGLANAEAYEQAETFLKTMLAEARILGRLVGQVPDLQEIREKFESLHQIARHFTENDDAL